MRHLLDVAHQPRPDEDIAISIDEVDGMAEGGLLSSRFITFDENGSWKISKDLSINCFENP